MNQSLPPRKRKIFVSKSIKFLIAAASVAGTVGFWGIFSKQNVQAVQTGDVPAALPAIPTLVALNQVDISSLPTVSGTSDPLAMLPVATQPPSISAPVSSGSVQVIQPAPVTQTKSSRK